MEIKNKKKIGLCLAFNGTNYGQNLQAYAVQQAVEKFGYETEIIDYTSGKDKGLKFSFPMLYFSIKMVTQKIKSKFANKENLNQLHIDNIRLRKEAADKFRSNNLHNIVKVKGYTNLKRLSKKYNAVMVGSDQIWTPGTAFTNFYTMRFAEKGVKRISYAPSLGVSEFPNYAKKQAADYWKQIDYLSVREQQGKDIIQSIIDIPVEVVVDPTYLFNKEEWYSFIPTENVVSKGYVFCYFLSDDKKAKKLAVDYASKHNLRTVCVLSNECNTDDEMFEEVLIGKSPLEFVNLIRNAECIFTDSFHGLAFSVINNKDFYIFYRVRKDVVMQRNSRIDNILSYWGLENRLLMDYDLTKCDKSIDYNLVNKKVEEFREKSLKFLENSLNSSM